MTSPTRAVCTLALVLAMSAVGTASAKPMPDFAAIVKNNRDAVVNIATTQKLEQAPSQLPPGMLEQLPPGHPLRRFFEQFGNRGEVPQRRHTSLGSGFIISHNGYVLTNAHVVAQADEVVVKLEDHREFQAEIVGADKRSDVALLKIDGEDLPTVEIGDSSKLSVGEWVLAIGSPFGLEYTATQGIVSALGRNLPNDTYTPFIQTDAAVNPGNSGGPLFNAQGNVVGINSQIYSRTGGYMGLSFAVPINTAMDIVRQLKEDGTVARGFLGVGIQPLSQGLAQSFGMDKPVGALVANVVPDSPAQKAGLKPGDVILRFDGNKVVEAADLPPMVGSSDIGETKKLQILRNGERRMLEITIGALSEFSGAQASADAAGTGSQGGLNLAVRDLTQQELNELDTGKRGLQVEDVGPGPAAEAGIRPADVLLQFHGRDLTTVADLRKAVADAPRGEPIAVQFRRGEVTLFLSLTLPAQD